MRCWGALLLFQTCVATATVAPADEEPTRLDTVTVTAPREDPLLQSDRKLQSIKDHLPGFANAPPPKGWVAPRFKDSVFARPEDPAGAVAYDVKAHNARTDAHLP